MHAFIVRPFGTKNAVDFDRVDRDLISPALDQLEMTGRTTQEIARAGNIRADMFHLLLTADLVVADISVHNANVFYELGVRHALRNRRTFLIRAEIDDVPFDLRTDRYLVYDPADPGKALPLLIQGLAATCREETIDSPVYNMLPGLVASDPGAFVVVPETFQEEVERARRKCHRGDLRFLAAELEGKAWAREGLRVIGEAQMSIGDFAWARETWVSVRNELPRDLQANLRLGTVYQKLGDLVRSDEALDRVTGLGGVNAHTLGEAHSLLGSNDQTRWRSEWSPYSDLQERQKESLRSPFLLSALNHYRDGFQIDPTYYYSGICALSMATVLTEVAAAQPEVWMERFESEQEAAFQLEDHKRLRCQLAAAVEFSLAAAKRRATRDHDESDPWLPISVADCAFLLSKSNVRQCYRDALSRVEQYRARVARRQFELFGSLGLMSKSVNAVAPLFEGAAQDTTSGAPCKVLLFTGHRLDPPGRSTPRFPAAREAEAREAIRNAVLEELEPGTRTIGIAGGASGGDLLFHEICDELGIERMLFIIVPREEYVRASVAPSGPSWIERFNRQFDSAKVRVYQQSPELPAWLQGTPEYTLRQRSDAWMLYNALALGGPNTTLIALWDGESGDGPGGTEHMVHSARECGARTLILDANAVFGLNR